MSMNKNKVNEIFAKWMARTASFRIIIPVGLVFVLFVLSVFLLFIPSLEKHMMEQKREMIRGLTDSTWSLLSEYSQRVKRGELTPESARSRAVNRIQGLRYGPEGKDYFWINDLHPKMIMHPYRSDLNGQDLTDFTDPNGKHLFVAFVNTVRAHDSGFVDYMWQWKDDPQRIVPKISYVKLFEPWGWVIGTGVYLEDVASEIAFIKKDLVKFFTGILAIILALLFYIIWQTLNIEKRRKQAMDAVQQSEDILQTIIAHSNEMFYLHNTDHKLRYVSSNSKDILGYFPEEMMIKRTELTTDNPVNSKGFEITEKAIKTGEKQPLYLLELKKKDGGVIWVEVDESPVKDKTGKVVAITGALRDVTQQKQMEGKVLKSEKGFRDLFNSITDLVYIQDIDGRFISVNPALCMALGYERDEIIGKPPSDFMKPELRHLFGDEYLKTIKIQGHHEGIAIYFTKDGSKIYVEYRSVLIRPEHGEAFISGTGRDVTQRVLADRQIKALQEEVVQSRKMEAIGTLTGGIAHDFNNIMGIIIGNTELALKDIPKWNPAYFNIEEIRSAGIRAAGIVNQLLSFSRKTDQDLKPMKIVPVIKDALKFLRSTIPTTIDIHEHINAIDETVLADPIQINQIMMNLCINASQAMEQTGGRLMITVEKVVLDEDSADSWPDLSKGNYVKVSVSDTGPGIDCKIIDRIFDPYFTTREVGKGSGMGLAVVHGIVKNSGGDITVDSEPGKGVTFSILFPLTTEKPEAETETIEDLPMGNETVLFVDDEKSLVYMAQEMLVHLGYRVKAEMNPIDALALFQSKPDQFDLVITDMTMPQMTGVAFSEKLLEIRKDIPIIICTGHSALVDEEKAKSLGLAAYVMKPVNMMELAQTIRKVLDCGNEDSVGN
ncbi:MAG: PAS domain S-box protein [Desulfobacteraceae bacterium]|nr:PAS domain S-box protein [Desulfobacteraceae bacterium]MBC2755280.1 PAS domain S-box protein [Desulfobacteraceae bacterium]